MVSRPPDRHRVASVDRQVDEDLFHRCGIDHDGSQIGRERGDQLHVLVDQTAQQFLELLHQRIDVDQLRLQHLPAAEREQLSRERRRALPGRLNLQQIRTQRILLRDLVEDQVAIAENRGQQIVEVVGHSACELTDRLHLLRLAELLFEPAPLRDVASVDHDAADRRIVEAVDADAVHDSPRAIRVMEPHLCVDRRARVAESLHQPGADQIAILGVQEVEDRAAHQLLRGPSQVTLRRGAEIGDAALGVDQQQRIGAVLDERAKAFFAGAERGLGLPPLPLFGVQRQRMPNRPFERLDRQVDLAEIVGGAGLHRLDGHLLGAAARQHDDRRVNADLPDLAKQGRGRCWNPASSRRMRRRTDAPSARRAPRHRRPRCGSGRRARRRRRGRTPPPSARARAHRPRSGDAAVRPSSAC